MIKIASAETLFQLGDLALAECDFDRAAEKSGCRPSFRKRDYQAGIAQCTSYLARWRSHGRIRSGQPRWLQRSLENSRQGWRKT